MRTALFTAALLSAVSATVAAAQQTTPKEEAAMRKQNEQFTKAHPPQPDSYKQTKQYKAQSAQEKAKTDMMVRTTQKGVENLKKQSAPCPSGKVCASSGQ